MCQVGDVVQVGAKGLPLPELHGGIKLGTVSWFGAWRQGTKVKHACTWGKGEAEPGYRRTVCGPPAQEQKRPDRTLE